MITLRCSYCSSQLVAKDHLAGECRCCPKCGHLITIVPCAPAKEVADVDNCTDASSPHQREGLPAVARPQRLNRGSFYVICDASRVLATWADSSGWMLLSSTGPIPAKRNADKLPTQGRFQLVELRIALTSAGKRLVAVHVFQLASRWALTALAQSEDTILGTIRGPGCLNQDQKRAVRRALKERFMPPVWEHAKEILAYFANADQEVPGVREAS